MQRITPFLWFDNQAEEAAKFYVSVFKNSQIIFSDASSRDETYKSGRFLYADEPANGEVALDSNKAENPPCAFTPFATCPLPPPGNSLDLEIKAVEKRYDHWGDEATGNVNT